MIGGLFAKVFWASSGEILPQMCSGRIGTHICSSVPRGSEHSNSTV